MRNVDSLCEQCRKERSVIFPEILWMEKIDGDMFSPFFEGFSSLSKVEEHDTVDFVVISESIGNLDHHMKKIREGKSPQNLLKEYYMVDPLETFNQQETRRLLRMISDLGKTFYFTDVIKCYVMKNPKKNFQYAAEYCSENLRSQIQMLKPRIIVLLGRLSEKMFFTKVLGRIGYVRMAHASALSIDEKTIVYSEFPSAMNADRFVKMGGIMKLKEKISILSKSSY